LRQKSINALEESDEITRPFLDEIVQKSDDIFRESLSAGELPDKDKYQKQIADLFLDAMLIINGLGRKSVSDIITDDAKAAGVKAEFSEIETIVDGEILTAKDAIKALENMLNMKEGGIYETILKSGDIDKLVNLIAGNSYDDFVEYINRKATTVLSEGKSYADWYKSLPENSEVLRPGYWQTVWNTNYTTAYNIGIQQESERLKEFIAYQEYIAVLDSDTTELCTALDGKIRKATDWRKSGLVPPQHYNCRSFLATISNYRAETEGIEATPDSYFEQLKKDGIKPAAGFDKPLSIKNVIKSIDNKIIIPKHLSGFESKIKEAYKVPSKQVLNLLNKTLADLKNIDHRSQAYFSRFQNSVYITQTGHSSKSSTLRHEIGHATDYLYRNESKFCYSEIGNYSTAIERGKNRFKGRGYSDFVKIISNDIKENFSIEELRSSEFGGFQDIVDGLSNTKVKVRYGHNLSYWKGSGAVNKEVFANLMEIYGDEDGNRARKQVNFLKKYFPDIIEEHEKFLKENGNE